MFSRLHFVPLARGACEANRFLLSRIAALTFASSFGNLLRRTQCIGIGNCGASYTQRLHHSVTRPWPLLYDLLLEELQFAVRIHSSGSIPTKEVYHRILGSVGPCNCIGDALAVKLQLAVSADFVLSSVVGGLSALFGMFLGLTYSDAKTAVTVAAIGGSVLAITIAPVVDAHGFLLLHRL